jgi:AraC-like DNA-binding protein
MKSVIHPVLKLKRISNFPFQLDEIGIMVNHSVKVSKFVLDRYFFCFSFNKEKYHADHKELRPTFSILPPGTVISGDGTLIHDELFFSYPAVVSEKLGTLFNISGGRYNAVYPLDDEFMQNFMKLKELIAIRNTFGTADKLDTLAMQMIMTAYVNSMQNNDGNVNIQEESKIYEIALKLKHGEKLDSLLRKYGFSRRAFYYEWSRNFSVSPKHVRLEAKLEQAQKLLLTTNLSIAEVAERCEFSSLRYFHECFLKYFNSTPGAYRKRFNSH